MPTEKQLKYWESLKGKKHTVEHNIKISIGGLGKHKEHKPQQGFQKGHIDFNPNGKQRFKKGERLNEKHPLWKGDDVGLSGLHKWIERNLGKPTTCEHCGKTGLTGHKIHWANKDHTYQRNIIDWIRLCVDCHTKYDIKNNKKQFYGFTSK
jgi:hypothetical protein